MVQRLTCFGVNRLKRGSARICSSPLCLWAGVLLFVAAAYCRAESAPTSIQWRPWSDSLFAQAMQEHKLILLELEASGCHWCHVIDQQTYADPMVQQLVGAHFVAIRVDRDLRPDIANRYAQFDFPVTVMLQSDATEIVRKGGYISKENMASLLQAVIDDPSPGPSIKPEVPVAYAQTAELSPKLIASLNQAFLSSPPPDQGSDFLLKYLDADSIEYAELLAHTNRGSEERSARDVLEMARQLIDPVWGGAFQSLIAPISSNDPHRGLQYVRVQLGGHPDPTGPSWNDSHYEKSLSVQAQMMHIFSHAYRRWRDPGYLDAAMRIHRYVLAFLTSPEGAFYVSQDSGPAGETSSSFYFSREDAERRKIGVPQVDHALYVRENGWMVSALCALYATTNDPDILQEARRSADWVLSHRALKDGGFSHSGDDLGGGPYLGDTLAMVQAFLSLYEVTGERAWLKRAVSSEHFISSTFTASPKPGFVTSNVPIDLKYGPHADRSENALLVRVANLLFRYSSDADARHTAAQAMRYLGTPDIASAGPPAPILLAERQFTTDPVDLLVTGSKRDETAQALFRKAAGAPDYYKRVEWWDPAEGQLPRDGLKYPAIPHVAAIICRTSLCSQPTTDLRTFDANIGESSD
jgi:uncharacterized protein